MPRVVVPVRYPPNEHSLSTLREAVRIAQDEAAELTVLHVDQFHDSSSVSRRQLKRACEPHVDGLETVSYVVRRGLLVEETILEEIAAEEADIVVIGKGQAGRWRRMIRRLLDDPDIERFLEEELDCDVVTVATD
jgi:K+-sensing histidine kinase KdpD